MKEVRFPVIDMQATGKRIYDIRVERGVSVRQISDFMGFEQCQAVYKWQRGLSLPAVDNLLALSVYFQIPIEDILVVK